MLVNIAARVFVAGELLAEDTVKDVDREQFESLLPDLVARHAKLVGGRPFMIEIEFLNEPDESRRFFRFGTDLSRMVHPLPIALGGHHVN